MTLIQKQNIVTMRGAGDSYAKIAAVLEVSENTVKSYCQRNKLGAASRASFETPATTDIATTHGDVCRQCGAAVVSVPHKKQKHFCSDKCRNKWWNARPEAVNRKAVYKFTCAACGAAFSAYGDSGRKYCSRSCSSKSRKAAAV